MIQEANKELLPAKPQLPLPKVEPSLPGLGVQLLTAGTAACLADIVTFPLDTLKVRLQVQGEAGAAQVKGVLGTLTSLLRQEGFTALYSGIVPGLQRQMCFSAIRIGLYDTVKGKYIEQTGMTGGLGLLGCRVAAGITTGSVAILVAQPTDVVKIRMQAAGKKGTYNGVLDAYRTICREEGVKAGLYKGMLPNIARNCIINVGETVVYDAVKDGLVSGGHMVDGVPCHLASALVAGVTATLVASPVDVIKTRFMNSPMGTYRGAIHCASETFQKEGAKAFYKGFHASCLRLVSWNICLWLSYEQLKNATRAYYLRPNTQ